MSNGIFEHREFDDHERVVFCHDTQSGLRAIIAIHNTTLGPALGGCRMFDYVSEQAAINDVLRLSKGMSFKAALAGLPLGGGKSIIMANPNTAKTPALFAAMGRCVDQLQGRYIVAQDSGIAVQDLVEMGRHTSHVSGIKPAIDDHGRTRSGDPSPATAYGVFVGIRAALKHQRNCAELAGVRVAVQGAGSVGRNLINHLLQAGAVVQVSDINPDNLAQVSTLGDVEVLDPADILTANVDVLAPCAMGGVISSDLLNHLRAGIVAGAANNQLENSEVGRRLHERGVLYAPDYVINAGGLMHLHTLDTGQTWEDATRKVSGIEHSLTQIFQRAETLDQPTAIVADSWGREILDSRATVSACSAPSRLTETASPATP